MLHVSYPLISASPLIEEAIDRRTIRARRAWLLCNAPGRGWDRTQVSALSDAEVKEYAEVVMCDQGLDNYYRALIGLPEVPTTPQEDLARMIANKWNHGQIQDHRIIRSKLGIAPLPPIHFSGTKEEVEDFLGIPEEERCNAILKVPIFACKRR